MRRAIPIHRPTVGAREVEAIRRVLESRWLGSGPVTAEFERHIAAVAAAEHAVAVSSGTAALHLSLLALELEPGDEVIVPSLAHISAPQAVLAAGGTLVFADVELDSANLDPDHLRALVGSRTRAVLPVHYAGFPCQMEEILDVAREHGLSVVEDAAHAFGSTYRGKAVGSLGELTCFSFDPVKNITCGEGGAVTTNDTGLASRLRRAANLGVGNGSWDRRDDLRPWQYEAVSEGFRYQLSDVNAALGLAQLERLEELRVQKRALLWRYRDRLADLDGVVPLGGEIETVFPFLCVVRVLDGLRDGLADHLAADGVQAWVHFVPCHRQPAFSRARVDLPVTARLADELLTLPLHGGLDLDAVDGIVASIRAFFSP